MSVRGPVLFIYTHLYEHTYRGDHQGGQNMRNNKCPEARMLPGCYRAGRTEIGRIATNVPVEENPRRRCGRSHRAMAYPMRGKPGQPTAKRVARGRNPHTLSSPQEGLPRGWQELVTSPPAAHTPPNSTHPINQIRSADRTNQPVGDARVCRAGVRGSGRLLGNGNPLRDNGFDRSSGHLIERRELFKVRLTGSPSR